MSQAEGMKQKACWGVTNRGDGGVRDRAEGAITCPGGRGKRKELTGNG